jgi:hypothetical protein
MLSGLLTTLTGEIRSGGIMPSGSRRASWALIHPPLEILPARRRKFHFGRRHGSCSLLEDVKQNKQVLRPSVEHAELAVAVMTTKLSQFADDLAAVRVRQRRVGMRQKVEPADLGV